MQRHTITFLSCLLFTSWLLLSMGLNKVLASETPPAITPTPAPTDVISYEMICTETRPLGCPEDTSNLAISWLVECGGACSPKRECNFVRHVNGTPAPISTATPTPELTPTVTPPPTQTNCGQSIALDWEPLPVNFCGIEPVRRHSNGGFTNCVGYLSGYRMVNIRVIMRFGQDNLQHISDFDLSWLGAQNLAGSVTFRYCTEGGLCRPTLERTIVGWSAGNFETTVFPDIPRVYEIEISIGGNIGGANAISEEDAIDWIVLNDIRFCASDAIFPAETPTPTPSPTGTPEPQPDCTTDVERLFRVASVPSCGVDDDLVAGWFNQDGEDIELELREIPENSNCYADVLAYERANYKGERLTISADLSDYVWVSKVVIDVDARYSEITNVDWDGMRVVLYNDRELIYEYDFNHAGDHPNEYTINIPNIQADGIGVSIPVIPKHSGSSGVDTTIELYHLEVYGSPDLPICGAGGVAPNDCQDPREVDLDQNYVPDLTMKRMGRRCFTIIPKISIILSFRGMQVCFDLYRLPDIQLLTFTLPTASIFHAMVAGYVLRNVMTR